MPGWLEILEELTDLTQPGEPPAYDALREKYLHHLHDVTGRAVIVYASAWLKKPFAPTMNVMGDDVHGLMTVCYKVKDENLDLILHSPGGDPAAAEQMIEYLRTRFTNIRAIVPLQAKSAATMMALGCDEVVMAGHSELGPTDPQISFPTADGVRTGPAHAIKRDFDRAANECAETPNKVFAWTPILRSYAGGLLDYCEQQTRLSVDVVASWLERYMLAGNGGLSDEDRRARALEVAESFGAERSYEKYRSHARPIRLPALQELGLNATSLEADPDLQDAVLSVYHTLDLSFNSPATKIIENHIGGRKVWF